MTKTAFSAFTISNGSPQGVDISVAPSSKRKNVFDRSTSLKLKKLQKIYDQLPQTTCEMCGGCCCFYETKAMYSIEYFNIYKYVQENFSSAEIRSFDAQVRINLFKTQEMGRKGVKIEMKDRMRPCIFFDQEKNICGIQSVKPLVCRTYGMTFGETQQKRKKKDKSFCSKAVVANKKDAVLLKKINPQLLYQEVAALSKNYAIIGAKGKDLSLIKSQDLERWFMVN